MSRTAEWVCNLLGGGAWRQQPQAGTQQPTWSGVLHRVLVANEVRLVTYVPDNVLKPLIAAVHGDPFFDAFCVTREEEGLGIICGAWMGGMRGVAADADQRLCDAAERARLAAVAFQIPALMIVSERGTLGEFNYGQALVCRTMRPVLDSLAIEHHTCTRLDELEFIADRTIKQAVATQAPAALILSPLLTGGKVFEAMTQPRQATSDARAHGSNTHAAEPLRDHEAAGRQADARRSRHRRHRQHQFRPLVQRASGRRISTCWAAWGSPFRSRSAWRWRSPIARVIALEGDGSLLMQLGCLSTVAIRAPKNLTIVVMDNGIYQITGAQQTATAAAVDLVAIARALRARREPLGGRRSGFRRAVCRGAGAQGAVADRAPHRRQAGRRPDRARSEPHPRPVHARHRREGNPARK